MCELLLSACYKLSVYHPNVGLCSVDRSVEPRAFRRRLCIRKKLASPVTSSRSCRHCLLLPAAENEEELLINDDELSNQDFLLMIVDFAEHLFSE